MKVGVPQETFPGERRVALVPEVGAALEKLGLEVLLQSGAGDEAGFPDSTYRDKGATIVADRAELFRTAELILQVRGFGANTEAGRADLELMHADQIFVGSFDPLSSPQPAT